MADWLEEHGVRLVVLAGYMRLLTPAFLDRFRADRQRPPVAAAGVPGLRAIERARSRPASTTTGVTVHLVDEGVDTGPGAAPGAGAGRAARRRSRSGSTRSSTGCCPRW